MDVPRNSTGTARKNSPVFVVGCHRSGTNLLYDTLLSAGGFAIYRGYLPIHKMLIPHFGSMKDAENRQYILRAWLQGKGFRRSGLEATRLSERIIASARNGGDFIRIVMDEIAAQQNASRWAVYDPDNVLYIRRIKAEIPNALFIHIVRDGRDIALSLRKMGEFRPLPWDRKPASLAATALYWRWMVRRGREQGKPIVSDYAEINFEELVQDPRRALATLSTFLEQDLDYDRIQAAGLGRLSQSNSSFRGIQKDQANPVNRWKEKLPAAEVAELESLVGDCLRDSGYALTMPAQHRKPTFRHTIFRAFYTAFLDFKFWMKIRTPAGRLTSLSALEIAESNVEDDKKLTPSA